MSNLDPNNSLISFKDDAGHQTAPGCKRPDLSIQTIFDAESMAPPDTPQVNGETLEMRLTRPPDKPVDMYDVVKQTLFQAVASSQHTQSEEDLRFSVNTAFQCVLNQM